MSDLQLGLAQMLLDGLLGNQLALLVGHQAILAEDVVIGGQH